MKFYEFDEKQKRVDIFNERFYPKKLDDGSIKWYRNVTTILGIINKGYGYDEWLKQTGYTSEYIVDQAGKFGTTFHNLVERYLHREKVSYYDIEGFNEFARTALWERFNLWMAFWDELNEKHEVTYKSEGIEYVCYNDKYEYAGTVDFCCVVDGANTIFDWKSGNYVGDSQKLQLTAYMAATNTTQARIVHIPAKKPNKKGYKIIEVDYQQELFDLFIASKKLFDSQNKDLPKVLTLPLEFQKEN